MVFKNKNRPKLVVERKIYLKINMEKKEYENLVFEGGGVLSFSYFGVIIELERLGMLQKFKRFAGTSVGAIFAALLAAEFTALEILRLQKKSAFLIKKGTQDVFQSLGRSLAAATAAAAVTTIEKKRSLKCLSTGKSSTTDG